MSELTAEDLPWPLRSFAARFGMAPVSNLVERFGGNIIFVSKRLEGKHYGQLCDALGCESAGNLCRYFGGQTLYVPSFKRLKTGRRNAALVAERDDLAKGGMGERDLVCVLSRRYDLSERQVWRILKQSWTVDAPEVAQ